MKIRTASLALLAGLTVAAPTAAFAAPATPIVQVEKKSAAPAEAPQQDASRYADREAADKQVAEYEGGQTVVIALSTGALLVIIILLLIL